MSNCLANHNSPRTPHARIARRAERASHDGQIGVIIGCATAVPTYRNSLHRARRARAVLVASAADVIDRAL